MRLTVIALLLLSSITALAQQVILDFNFAAKNRLEVSSGSSDFPIMKEDAQNYQVFILGEKPGIAINDTLRIGLLDFFYQNSTVRNVVLPLPLSYESFVKRYMETGDSSLLFNLLYSETWTAYSSQSFFYFMEQLQYRYQQLKTSTPLKVHCIAPEKDYHKTLLLLENLTPNSEPPTELKGLFTKMEIAQKQKQLSEDDAQLLSKELYELLEDNRNEAAEYIGSNFLTFEAIIQNFYLTFKKNEDRLLYHNFEYMAESKAIPGNFLVLTEGEKALNKRRWIFKKHFAQKLNYKFKSPVYNQVMSITYSYIKCQRMGEFGLFTEAMISKEAYDKMVKNANSNITLFKTQGEGTIYPKEAGYMHYTLLIRNQGPATPLGE